MVSAQQARDGTRFQRERAHTVLLNSTSKVRHNTDNSHQALLPPVRPAGQPAGVGVRNAGPGRDWGPSCKCSKLLSTQ
jgi:hypothetical protein